MKIEKRYLDGTYLSSNPNWDRDDSAWKAKQVFHILSDHKIHPTSICEVGCGSGDILRYMKTLLPKTRLVGYDVSPQAAEFWKEAIPEPLEERVEFHLGDFLALNKEKFSTLLMLDVFEHVRDPFTFLEESRRHSETFVFHIPLDLSAVSVARKGPLMNQRRCVGHLNYYTKDLALETLSDCGFEIIDWRYTGASFNIPNRSFKTWFARLPRMLASALDKDWAVRVLGGETLIVLAK